MFILLYSGFFFLLIICSIGDFRRFDINFKDVMLYDLLC